MLKEKVRVVVYVRVGCKEQVTIFRKNEEIREVLEKHKDDWEVIDRAFDYGISGRKLERPGLNHVLEMCKEKQIDMVVTLDANMLARDVLVYKQVYTTIRDSGVELYIDELHKGKDEIKKSFPLDDSSFQSKIFQLVFA